MKKTGFSQDKVVYAINYILLTLLLIAVLYPLIYIISCSFSSGAALSSGKVTFFPVEPTLESYEAVFGYSSLWTGYFNSIVYTAAGTFVSITLTLLAAYPLSLDDFRGNKYITMIFLFTMMFSGGLIPTYLLIKDLGILNSIWAIILPSSISAYNMIVARTFFKQTIPKELREASDIDGCSDFGFFVKMVLPLSAPIIAVLSLWVAVGLWNSYFAPLIYLNEETKYPLQLILRKILLMSQVNFNNTSIDPEVLTKNQNMSEMLKYGSIVLASLPLMILYPFVQKHFVQGVMIGSVKG